MIKRKLIIATSNRNKVIEIKELLKHLELEVLSKDELDIDKFETIEDGETLEENSQKKARDLKERVGHMVIADDSGLFVKGLNGEPGVHSSRYAGAEGMDDLNIEKLLDGLKDKDRDAYFKTVVSLIGEDGKTYSVEGTCHGKIAEVPKGTNGFGYDPIFIPNGYDKTFAELGNDVKNQISHRAKALEKLRIVIEELTKDDKHEDNSNQ